MENSPHRRTAWIVGAILFDGLLISVVLFWVNTLNNLPKHPLPDLIASMSAVPSNLVPPVITDVSATPQQLLVPAATSTGASSTSAGLDVSPGDETVKLTIIDQDKHFSWNEFSFKYPGNWVVSEERDVRSGISFTSTTKEQVKVYCPEPALGFEGWDFDHPLMKLNQNIPGNSNQYKKSLVIAQPVLEWGANGKPVLDPKNKKGLGWMSMLAITKTIDPSTGSSSGCLITAVFNHVPSGTEKQSLQTMYNSITVDPQFASKNTTASIIRYINQNYAFSLDFPKSWLKIKEENLTTAFNQDNPKPYQAVIRLTPDGAAPKSGRQVLLFVYDKSQLPTNPQDIDMAGVTFLKQNNQFGYYASSTCDATMSDVPDCRTLDEVKATNQEIADVIKTFKLN